MPFWARRRSSPKWNLQTLNNFANLPRTWNSCIMGVLLVSSTTCFGEPTHTLVPYWMPSPLPLRNQCTGWFTPTNTTSRWVLSMSNIGTMARRVLVVSYKWISWGIDHTDRFWHHPLTSPAVILWKVVGQDLFFNIIPNNFTIGTDRRVWCDRGMSLRNNWLKLETSGEVPILLEVSIKIYLKWIKQNRRCQHVTGWI
jgi:hypothetical protein